MHVARNTELGKAVDTPLFPDTLPGIEPAEPKPPINPEWRPGYVPPTKPGPKEVVIPGVGPISITKIVVIATIGLVTYVLVSQVGR